MLTTIERSHRDLGLPKKTILLTFDDGPVDEGQTAELLDVLRAHDVRASFCLIGNRIQLAPEVCRQLVEDGNMIANHTHRHFIPFLLSAEQLEQDILRSDEAVSECLGRPFTSDYFRPPGGLLTPKVRVVMRDMEKKVLPITFFAWDTMRAPKLLQRTIPRQIVTNAVWKNGGVFVVHEAICPLTGQDTFKIPPDRTWVPETIDRLITSAKRKGFAFPEPQEMLDHADAAIRRMI